MLFDDDKHEAIAARVLAPLRELSPEELEVFNGACARSYLGVLRESDQIDWSSDTTDHKITERLALLNNLQKLSRILINNP